MLTFGTQSYSKFQHFTFIGQKIGWRDTLLDNPNNNYKPVVCLKLSFETSKFCDKVIFA